MINENAEIEIIQNGIKTRIQISDLIELIFNAIYDELTRKTHEPKGQ